MEQTIWVWSSRNIRDQLWSWSSSTGRSHRKVPFHLTKLLSPAYKDNNQTRGGLGRVSVAGMYCAVPLGTWNFLNFKPEFLLNGKHPLSPLKCLTFLFNPIVNNTLFFELLRAKTDACSWSFFPFRTLFDNPLTTCLTVCLIHYHTMPKCKLRTLLKTKSLISLEFYDLEKTSLFTWIFYLYLLIVHSLKFIIHNTFLGP